MSFLRFVRVLALALPLAYFSTTAVASATTADLAITDATLDSKQHVGTEATYSFTITNRGPDATEATLTDQLGDAEALVSVTTTQGTCTQAAPATCSFGTVAPGAGIHVEIKVTYTRESAGNDHVYRVTGPATNADPDSNNDANGSSYPVINPPEQGVGRPEAVTGGWSRTQATLLLDAELSPFGAGTYYFQYGKTKAYGKKSEVKTIKGQAEGLERSTKIEGLAMATRYHYRVVLVVDGKAYRGRDRTATTLGKLKFPTITLEVTKRASSSTTYKGSVGNGFADAPGACKGTIEIQVYTSGGADLLQKRTTVRKDCGYSITVPFGTTQARRYGPKGSVIVQARFSGNYAVAGAASGPDNP